jgi:hypothetical protein
MNRERDCIITILLQHDYEPARQKWLGTMKRMSKDDILTTVAILLLFITAMITFTIYSWLMLVAIILLLIAWYYRF